jgi:hypothetical protein
MNGPLRTDHYSFHRSLRLIAAFRRDPVASMDRLAATGADLVWLNSGFRQLYFCFHPELARRVLVEDAAHYRKARAVFDQLVPLTGPRGLVQLEGDDVRAIRSFDGLAYLEGMRRLFGLHREMRGVI